MFSCRVSLEAIRFKNVDMRGMQKAYLRFRQRIKSATNLSGLVQPTEASDLQGAELQNHENSNYKYVGVSENSVPLNPMVNDHYPYQMATV